MNFPTDPRPPLGGDDVSDLYAGFGACDADGDGSVVYAEFERLLQGLGSRLGSAQRRAEFARIDTDGDGLVNLVEFERWWGAA
jgi:Ca2+-binding EF-hand superfamily protein